MSSEDRILPLPLLHYEQDKYMLYDRDREAFPAGNKDKSLQYLFYILPFSL